MLGLISQGSPDTAQVIAMASELALPTKSRAVLKDIAEKLANLALRHTELAAMEQVDADRKKAIDKFAAELNERAAKLEDASAALSARTDKFTKVVAEFQSKLAGHEAALEAPDGNVT